MPAQVLPDGPTFGWLEHNLLRRGFRKRSRKEFRSDFRRLEPKPPSPRPGREAGFTFSANGYEVVVWTTFVESAQVARNRDAGWVLIKEGDEVLYFSRPIHRTKHFLHNLLLQASIARARVLHRPLCPDCSASMDIVAGKTLKARFWKCTKPAHRKPVHLPWDYGLPMEVLPYIAKIRQARKRYRQKLKAQGKKPGVALLKRKGWTIGKQQNKL